MLLVLLLVLLLALGLPAAPASAQVPEGLEVTGWILQSGSNRLVARNADGITTLSVAAVALARDLGLAGLAVWRLGSADTLR